MHFAPLLPRKALTKLYRKQKIVQTDFDRFWEALEQLTAREQEADQSGASEEHQKGFLRDFFRETFYADHAIAPKKLLGNMEVDFALHKNTKTESPVELLLEVKTPKNKVEMIHPGDINRKALHEAILYYLWEREVEGNHEIKHIIITDIFTWFVFDAKVFAEAFGKHKKLVSFFHKWREGKTDQGGTAEMYDVLKTICAEQETSLEGVFFDLREIALEPEKKRTALYKLFSPEHLLKKGTVNDNNSLNKKFYAELLHIIGLEEAKEGSKKVIQRKQQDRQQGSLLENTMQAIQTRNRIRKLDDPKSYGTTEEEQLFAVALEVILLWVNRILFLKLLEAQLLTYHQGKSEYRFLTTEKVGDFDNLHYLFFNVLAERTENRKNDNLAQRFAHVPYLNSSLFEFVQGSLEDEIIEISDLNDSFEIEISSQTVLTDANGKKKTGKLKPLDYLFAFLEAYDFASESDEEVQKDTKTLISASVLGLIFEKINGYKDGSFFTPSFITMYMCRETIRRAVVQQFHDSFRDLPGFENLAGLRTLTDVYNQVDRISLQEANAIIDSLKICDPAVGSGHFLVSALNEIIVIKSELGILCDQEGKKLRGYDISIENDELMITDEEGEVYEYRANASKEIQRVQETLFEEKKKIIENCLFGVDINQNSVNICRLRLWIELLKNAYYTTPQPPLEGGQERQLQTLPNIDINIKCGNSLISQFTLDAKLGEAFGKNEVKRYKDLVKEYKETKDKKKKWEVEKMLKSINTTLRGGVQHSLFDSVEEREKKEEEKNIYKNAFEWRFAFPEVLDEKGDFMGFDVVIGNPPYMRIQELMLQAPKETLFYNKNFSTAKGNYDIYNLFIERFFPMISKRGKLCFILPHKFLISDFGLETRKFLKEDKAVESIIHFGSDMVFEDASTYTCLLTLSQKNKFFDFEKVSPKELPEKKLNFEKIYFENLSEEKWHLGEEKTQKILGKIKNIPRKTKDCFSRIFQGIATSADKIYLIEGSEEENFIKGFSKELKQEVKIEKGLVKPLLKGNDVSRYADQKNK